MPSRLRKPTNSRDWQPLRDYITRGRADVPLVPLEAHSAATLRELAEQIPWCPRPIDTHVAGPEPIAGHVEFDVPFIDNLSAHVTHCSVDLLQSILFDLGVPAVLAGHLGSRGYDFVQYAIWFDLGPVRLLAIPSLTTHGNTLSMQLAHSVWCWQRWMTGHDPTSDADWADLVTNEKAYFFREGYAYQEATLAYAQNKFFWGIYSSPLDKVMHRLFGRWTNLWRGEVHFGNAESCSEPLLKSEATRSFVCFQVGERACSEGSPAGVVLQRVAQCMAFKCQQYRAAYGLQAAVDPVDIHVRRSAHVIREQE